MFEESINWCNISLWKGWPLTCV